MVVDIGFCIFLGIVSGGVAVIVNSLGKRQRKPFVTDSADYYYKDVFLRYLSYKKPLDLTIEDFDLIWAYASNHMAMFLTWVINNGFYGEISNDTKEDLQLVKSRKMTGTEFLAKHCDYMLTDDDFCPEILPFVESYYYQTYFRQYNKLFGKKLKMPRHHPSPFSWNDYDLISKRITRSYKLWKFFNKPIGHR